jgi:hypothetical protein
MIPTSKVNHDRPVAAGHHDLRHAAARAKRWGAYRARLAVSSRTRLDSAGYNHGRSTTVVVLVRAHSCWVAGQGFEPWEASADGFTVRSHLHFAGHSAVHERGLT